MGKLPLFSRDEIESLLVDCGETVPEDYQHPEGDDLWKVINEFLRQLGDLEQKKTRWFRGKESE